jgi:hypothetical protein
MTGLFSYVIAWYIYQRNYQYDRWLSIAIFSFSTIQWLEAILWLKLDNYNINEFVTTYLIPFTLILEPVAVLYGATLFEKVDNKLIIFYILFLALGLSQIGHDQSVTTIDSKHSLKWWENENIIYGIVFATLLILPIVLYMRDSKMKVIIIAIIILALIFAFIYHPDNWTSNWCLYGNALSICALIYPYF